MAGKVPSFITGGTLWFTDLTTSDRIRLPILLALTVWVNLKLSSRRHVQGQPAPNKFLGALTFLGAAAAGFPNAMYCYWITSGIFSIAFSIVVVKPQVRKLLGMPLMPPSNLQVQKLSGMPLMPPSADKKPAETSSKPSMSSSVVDRRRRKGEKGRKGMSYKGQK